MFLSIIQLIGIALVAFTVPMVAKAVFNHNDRLIPEIIVPFVCGVVLIFLRIVMP